MESETSSCAECGTASLRDDLCPFCIEIGVLRGHPDFQIRSKLEPQIVPGSILVVDDSYMIRQRIKNILEAAGHTVWESSDPGEAWEIVKQGHRFDLVVLDIQMAGGDGFEFCRVLKSYGPTRHIPVLMCSGTAHKHAVVNARRSGASDFIAKPFHVRILVGKIERLLNRSRVGP